MSFRSVQVSLHREPPEDGLVEKVSGTGTDPGELKGGGFGCM